jgi:hypothetical protein
MKKETKDLKQEGDVIDMEKMTQQFQERAERRGQTPRPS